jgi:alpha,alpha-trehalose-phosphate synthase [UDP-forming]
MTKDKLKKIISEELGDYKLIIASNREPYIHTLENGKIKVLRPSGGAVAALDPVMRACGGTWIAHGSGNADKRVVDDKDRIKVPPDEPSYTLRRLWLSKEEERGYYYGFSNEALWPLSHIAYTRPIFREQDWQMYKKVNKKFAEAILEEKKYSKKSKILVFIQDYHLALVAKYIKEKAPEITCAYFWHIPWPNPEVFRICPFKKEIIDGFLANDLIGFHIRYHCDNFIETVEREIEAKVDRERTSIIKEGHESLIRAFPISVDFDYISDLTASDRIKKRAEELKEELSLEGKKVFLGCDRVDYTKGIPERLIAFDKFLERYPEYKEKAVFVQIGAVSRILIQAYKDINSEINRLVEEINWKHSTSEWTPIIFSKEFIPYEDILAFYLLADVIVVSSLHDGMNLVAKEYISSNFNNKGTVILSQFTGSARELQEAVFINPYDINEFVETLKTVLSLPEEEREKRMKMLRETVRENNIYRWAAKAIMELSKHYIH